MLLLLSNVLADDNSKAGIITAIVVVIVILIISTVIFVASRLKKCPSDKIMVVYGKVGRNHDGSSKSAKCIHGGTQFILPFLQAYQYLDLTPISINVDLKNALSKQNIRIDVPSVFTVGISTEPGIMQNAAERLLGLSQSSMQDLAKDIIFGQLRLVIATMEIEEINTDRDMFLEAVSKNVEIELKKIGLRLINVNVVDIKDESGYIDALGKEAAAKAINDAKKSVAEKNRDGSIGEANALRDQRIEVASANSTAVEGENNSKGIISQSNALYSEINAESDRRAKVALNVANAKALEESYKAQETAERARGEREKATRTADTIVQAEIEKQKKVIEAEAEAERIRKYAQGEADATFANLEAQARGTYQILSKQAEGFAKLVSSAGSSSSAIQMLIADKLERLVEIQVEAIKNLKFDKITVWDQGGNNANGGGSTANFAQGLLRSIPPLQDLYRSVGLDLPTYLVKDAEIKDAEKPEAKKPASDKKPQ
jgi:flotillin